MLNIFSFADLLPFIFVNIQRQVLAGFILEFSFHVDVVHSVPDILEDRVVGHEQVLPLEPLLDLVVLFVVCEVVYDGCEEVDLRQVEQRVVHVNTLLLQCDELVGVQHGDLLGFEELESVAGEQYVAEPVNLHPGVYILDSPRKKNPLNDLINLLQDMLC